MSTKPTLADVDGTNGPAVAVLVSVTITPDGPVESSQDRYVETDYPNPWRTARAMRDSCAPDFPDREFTIVGNARARYLRWVADMDSLLGPDPESHSPRGYLEVV